MFYGEETFIVEQSPKDTEEDFFEEPESLRQLPPIQPAPTLRDVANLSPTNYVPPTKINKPNDLSEPSRTEIEQRHSEDHVTGVSIFTDQWRRALR